MDIITADWETFYGDDYTLSKLTTEQYVRDPRFEAILCSFKINSEPAWWVPRDEIAYALRQLNLDRRAVLMHHAHFDALILYHHYGIRPKMIFDTLGMGRALHGANAGLSLAKLAERYGIGKKGEEVILAKNLRFADFSPQQLARYGKYGCNDVDLTYQLGIQMIPQFTREELRIHDQVIRMFTEPVLELDAALLTAYRDKLAAEKNHLLLKAGITKDELMSNDKFANALMWLGVDPPRKISKTTGVETWAFAKTDAGMQELQEHPDEEVQVLVEARLKNRTTIAEKGADRLIGMSQRGPATVYLKYSGASGTHRLSGGDKFNWQSMKRGSDLRNAVMAPADHDCVVVDSSTIEARWLDYLAGQDDMVEVYRRQDNKTGPDMYCVIAEKIYGRVITKDNDPDERQMGKVAKLGLGFGMGDKKFMISVRGQAKVQAKDKEGNPLFDALGNKVMKPLILTPEFSKFVVDVYRNGHPQVRKLWKRAESALEAISKGKVGMPVDFRGLVVTCKDGLLLPNGMRILYPDLRKIRVDPSPDSPFKEEWEFWNGKMRERIYGAKVVENIIQALARITVFKQCLDVVDLTDGMVRWAHSVHDEGVFVCHKFYSPWVLEVAQQCFRTPPAIAPDLPVNCEGGFHQRYGKAKK